MRKAVANAFKDMHRQQMVESERQQGELQQQLAKAVAELAVATQEVQKLRVLEEEVQKMKELEKEVQKLRMVEKEEQTLRVLEEERARERQRNLELEELIGRLRLPSVLDTNRRWFTCSVPPVLRAQTALVWKKRIWFPADCQGSGATSPRTPWIGCSLQSGRACPHPRDQCATGMAEASAYAISRADTVGHERRPERSQRVRAALSQFAPQQAQSMCYNLSGE